MRRLGEARQLPGVGLVEFRIDRGQNMVDFVGIVGRVEPGTTLMHAARVGELVERQLTFVVGEVQRQQIGQTVHVEKCLTRADLVCKSRGGHIGWRCQLESIRRRQHGGYGVSTQWKVVP